MIWQRTCGNELTGEMGTGVQVGRQGQVTGSDDWDRWLDGEWLKNAVPEGSEK